MAIASLIIIVLTVVGIIFTSIFKPSIKIKGYSLSLYWPIALLGALILLAGTFLPINEFFNGLTSSNGMNPLKILVLFISMTCISLYLDELGFFSFVASSCLLFGMLFNIRQFIFLFSFYERRFSMWF